MVYDLMSSAKSFNEKWWFLKLERKYGRSLMYIKNRRGPSTLPWGTPPRVATKFEKQPSTIVH